MGCRSRGTCWGNPVVRFRAHHTLGSFSGAFGHMALPQLTSRVLRLRLISSRRPPAQALSSPVHTLAQLASPQQYILGDVFGGLSTPHYNFSPRERGYVSLLGMLLAGPCLAYNMCSNQYFNDYIHMASTWISLFCLMLVLICSLIIWGACKLQGIVVCVCVFFKYTHFKNEIELA